MSANLSIYLLPSLREVENTQNLTLSFSLLPLFNEMESNLQKAHLFTPVCHFVHECVCERGAFDLKNKVARVFVYFLAVEPNGITQSLIFSS